MNIRKLNKKGKLVVSLLVVSVLGKYAYSSIINPGYSLQEDVESLFKEDEALAYIKNALYEGISLDEALEVFQEMCKIPLGYDLILYETGAYALNLEPAFYLCLVRQYRNSDGASSQIHMNLKYTLDMDNRQLRESVWNDELEEDIFSYVKRSETYNHMKDRKEFAIMLWVD